MSVKFETVDIELCVDCVMLIANGECTHDDCRDGDDDTECPTIQGHMRLWDGGAHPDGWVLHLNCPDDCDGYFSHGDCDGCGETLAGERHPGVAMREVG